MLEQAARQHVLDELHHLEAACDNAGHGDAELVWCEMRVSVERLRSLLPAKTDVPGGDESPLLRQLVDFLDELWDSYELGSSQGCVDFPINRRPRELVAWFIQKLAASSVAGNGGDVG